VKVKLENPSSHTDLQTHASGITDNPWPWPTIWIDCHPIQTNWCPTSAIPSIFTPEAFPGTTVPIHPGLGQAPNMLLAYLVAW